MWSWLTRLSVTPEDLADLAEGQPVVVVEGDDDLLPLGQAGDRVGERVAQLASTSSRSAGLVSRESPIVSIREQRLAARGDAPRLVERDDRRVGDLGDRGLELAPAPSRGRGQLLVGGSALQPVLQLGRLALDLARARARTERGTQSSERSSSMIEPLMRATA